MSDIHNATSKQEELTEEEFIELVLEEQQKALAREREERLHGKKPKKQKPLVRWMVWGMAMVLFFNTFALVFQIYSIPAIEFIKVSTRLSAQEDIQTYKKAVVEISTGSSKGTGFAISPDGLIVTNAHVVEDATSLSVVFPDEGLMEATLIESYPAVDLALVQVEAEQLPYLPLAEDPPFSADEHIYFIGNPLAFTGIANEGTLLESIQLEDWQEPVMMLKAPVYRGNSGSPVIDQQGKVIGIIFATMKHEPIGRVGLFVPVQQLHHLLEAQHKK
ncbi:MULTISPECIES: S1 family peptidase [unclassified Lysinibacillus]|jgi:serine protease Do|uniref:S1 family peptidase n=1 Tax=unclassified Lysinibacillus TaxID=2636778 RepID=UPI0008824D62|nr:MULTISPECIES: serine protease [unclassified Lysinibacillus]WCH49829.1 serine protease [Lysinibacillus sp. OF-1]SCY80280.1 Trypsin-like peptidase domain-containing protein [Lysinibacillus sp. SG9]SDB41389.1 Trypsin-like peptidase domain-containing protein [Lysinibacillus sp. TC-37]SFT00251.1 Trypsin-like peptidase domain-containing protein [Lysinibacillus sp. SG55]